MKKPKLPNQKKAYKDLSKRLNAYTRKIISIYETLAKESAKIATSTDFDGDGEFSFDDYPRTEKKVNALLDYYSNNMQALVYNGISDEWKNSNTLQDLLAKRVIGTFTRKIADAKQKAYFEHNNAAKKAFMERKIKGLGLSERIWNQRADVKEALEKALSVGIEKGMSAVKLSKKVSKYLNDYPSLAKAYKKKYGKAITIQNCEYRSVRLARNEINMAYRSAEQERWARMDYIKGKEIKTTNNPSHKHDMCDLLAGVYPKDFYWTGWHVNCMCYAVPVIMSEEEYWSLQKPKVEVPDNFNDWINENKDKFKESTTIPNSISQNEKYVDIREVLKTERRKQYEELRRDKNYKDVAINKAGGLKATHIGHCTHDEKVKPFFDHTMSSDDLENELMAKAYKAGHSVIFRNESEIKDGKTLPSLDMVFDGKIMDIRSVTSDCKSYRNQLKEKNEQLNRFCGRKDVTENHQTVCLYFHDDKLFSEEKVIKGYEGMKNMLKKSHSEPRLKDVVCIINKGNSIEVKEYNF